MRYCPEERQPDVSAAVVLEKLYAYTRLHATSRSFQDISSHGHDGQAVYVLRTVESRVLPYTTTMHRRSQKLALAHVKVLKGA